MAQRIRPVRDPNGDVFDIAQAHGVRTTNNGVMVTGANARLLHFIAAPDATKAGRIRDMLAVAIVAIAEKRDFALDWSALQ